MKHRRRTVSRRLSFDAGHRVVGHEGRCVNLHGHRYEVLVTAEVPARTDRTGSRVDSSDVDLLGRVIDFGVVKELVGGWIDQNLDHAMILCENDPHVGLWISGPLAGMRVYLLTENPTAENLAAHLLDVADALLASRGVRVVRVEVWETPNCSAVAERDDDG